MKTAPIRIGSRLLTGPLFLAPMAGVTDLPYRTICEEMGADYAVTEMVSAKAVKYRNRKTLELMRPSAEEGRGRKHPLAVQLFGSDPEILAETAAAICGFPEDDSAAAGISAGKPEGIGRLPEHKEERKPAFSTEETPDAGSEGFSLEGIAGRFDAVDINMGCPVEKVVRNGEGSALMRDPDLIYRIVTAVSSRVSVPVTVKIRSGFDEQHVNAVEAAKAAEAGGAALITVHGRTRKQMYSGRADRSVIRAVKDAVRIPVIGNGDIFTPEDAAQMLEETGCDGIAVARGCEGNPWIFRQIRTYLETGLILPTPGREERGYVILDHIRRMKAYKGERIAASEMRKHISWYTEGMENSARLRERVNSALTTSELTELVCVFFGVEPSC